MTDQLLDADTLPLVLLAAVGHPDSVFRDRLCERLDAVIEAGRPLHSAAEVREFLIDQPGSPHEPLYLEPLALDLCVRIVRLLFSHRTRKLGRITLRTISCEVLDDDGGLVINHQLKPICFERFISSKAPQPARRKHKTRGLDAHDRMLRKAGRRYRKMLGRSSVFVAGGVTSRLRQFDTSDQLLQAKCRVEDGFHLTLTGDLPWPASDLIDNTDALGSRRFGPTVRLADGSTLGKHRGFASLGLAVEFRLGELHLRTTTPEAVLRFSACLTRGERLVLQDAGPSPGRVVVLLRDFEGDSARLPAVVTYAGAETWLRGLPGIPLPLNEEERLLIAGWAYPPLPWLTNDLLETVH